jgi:hypothetical protein
MTDRARRGDEVDSVVESEADGDVDPGVDVDREDVRTGAYEVDDGIVVYDIENPLAWVEADAAVDVERMA